MKWGVDAASGWILGELEDGRKVPEATPYDRVSAGDGGMVSKVLQDALLSMAQAK